MRRLFTLVLSMLSVGALACGGGAAAGRSDAPPGSRAPGDASTSSPSASSSASSPASAPSPAAAPTSGAIAIDCGDFHTCALLADGSVRCWGRDTHGEAGLPAATDRVSPAPVDGVEGAVGIAAGTTFTCALLKDKTVRCWGTGRILGDGAARESLPPTMVPGLTRVEQIRASGLVTCARGSAGGVRCWGLESDVRRRATSTDVPELGTATDIAAASAHACARAADGTVRCWGDFAWALGAAPAMQRPKISDAVQIASGDDFVCALTRAETVRCWGRNDDGQLGAAPDEEVHTAPVEIRGVAGATGIAAGEGQACAVLRDGTVRCWGANEEGELGLGTRTTSELPQPAVKGLSSVRDVCIGSLHSCALTTSGDVYCWGNNPSGQLGDGTRERRATPTKVPLR